MDRKKLLIRIASLIFFIFILNYLAGKFYWYSAIWYFDIIMHFLGGLWAGLASIWFFSRISDSFSDSLSSISFNIVLKILLGVLVIGIAWEIFELYFINHIASNPFDLLDTISDIFFDLSGGLFAILYFFNQIMPKNKNKVE